MNCLYFGCLTCKDYTDAGYRHAYWTLVQPGIVDASTPVSVAAVLSAREYWALNGTEFLPLVRAFLHEHLEHQIVFGDTEQLCGDPQDEGYLDWMEIGPGAEISPRTMVAQGLTKWEDVEARYQHALPTQRPWWWELDDMRSNARQKFEALVSKRV